MPSRPGPRAAPGSITIRATVEAEFDGRAVDLVFQVRPTLAAFLAFDDFTLAQVVDLVTGHAFKAPSTGAPFGDVLTHPLSATVGYLDRGAAGPPALQGRLVFGPARDEPDPLVISIEAFGESLEIASVRSITVDYQDGELAFSADATIFGRPQTLEYPLPPSPPPEPPLISFEYLGVGQRVGPPQLSTSVPDMVAAMKQAIGPVQGTTIARATQLYRPDVAWLFAVDMSVKGILQLQVVLADPDLYGLWISLQKPPQLAGLNFEILYRKIDDEVGEFYAELTLPAAARTLQLGAASVTLPTIAVGIYTNGDFEVSLGWPLGDGSMTVQVFPFTGSGGLRFAKLSGTTASNVDWRDAGLVLEFGIAMSIGLGKDVSAGILSASMSIQLVGIFEGRLGWPRPAQLPPGAFDDVGIDLRSPSHYWFEATVGIVGVIQGSVDFAIIKASISATVQAHATLTFADDQPTTIVVDASIEVSASVTIGGFSLFGIRIAITLSFHFSADLTQTFVIDSATSAGERLTAFSGLLPLEAEAGAVALTLGGGRLRRLDESAPTLDLWLVPQITKAGGRAQVVASLMIDTGGGATSPFGRLVQALARQLIAARLGIDRAAADATRLDHDALLRLAADVAASFDRSGRPGPADYAAVVRLLSQDFTVTVGAAPTTGGATSAAAFPMLAELTMTYTGAASPVDFALVNPRSSEYTRRLAAYVERTMLQVGHADAEPAAGDPTVWSYPQLVATDWFGVVAHALTAELSRLTAGPGRATGYPRSVTLGEALDRLDYDSIAAQASRFLQHGLAVPAELPDDESSWPALPVLALGVLSGQQLPLPTAPAPDFELRLAVTPSQSPSPEWLVADIALQLGEDTALAELATWPVPAGNPTSTQLPLLGATPTRLTLSSSTPWRVAGAPVSLVALTAPARAACAEPGVTAAAVLGGDLTEVDFVPGTVVELTLRRVRSGAADRTSTQGQPLAFTPNLYQLGGTDDAGRALLTAALQSGSEAIRGIDIAYVRPAGPDTTDAAAPSGIVSAPLASTVRLVKTNLSTASGPPSADAIPDVEADWAWIGQHEAFLRLVVQCSIVNGGGFFLHYVEQDGHDLPETLFDQGESALIYLVVRYADSADGKASIPAAANVVVTPPPGSVTSAEQRRAAADPPPRTTWQLCPLRSEADRLVPLPDRAPTMPPGCVGFEVVREPPAASQLKPWQLEVAKLFNVVRYRVLAGDGFSLTPWGPPLGPGDMDPDETDGRWRYAQAVAVWRAAGKGPYDAVGKNATVQFRIGDGFGNLLDDSDQIPQLTQRVPYTDRLIGLEALPGLHASWVPGAAQSQSLLLSLRFTSADLGPAGIDADRYRTQLQTVLDTWTRWLAQLEDARLVEAVATTTMLPDSDVDVGAFLRDFASKTVQSIETALPTDLTPPADVSASQVVAVGSPPVQRDLLPLALSVSIRRDASLVVVCDGAPFGPAKSVTSTVPADIRPSVEGGSPEGLAAFASAFQQCFPSLTLLVGAGSASNLAGTGSAPTLWASALATPTAGRVTYLAPTPASTELLDGIWSVRTYDEDLMVRSHVEQAFSDVDLDAWAERLLRALDQLLAPDLATDIAVVAARTPEQGPDLYQQLMNAKAALASAVAATVSPVFADDHATDLDAARSAFRQRLLDSLGSAYAVATVIQVAVDATPAEVVDFYGTVAEHKSELPGAGGVTYSVGRVVCGPGHPSPTLNVLVTPSDPARQRCHTAALDFNASFVEHDFGTPGPGGYTPSSWLKYAVPADAPSVALGQLSIPIPLRAYPAPPSLLGQASVGAVTDLRSAASWDYGFSFLPSRVAQDEIGVHVTFNPAPDSGTGTVATAHGAQPPSCLFEALARFDAEYPQIAARFDAIHAAAAAPDPDQHTLEVAQRAIRSAVALFADAATVWSIATPPTAVEALDEPALPPVESVYRFDPDSTDTTGLEVVAYQRPDASWPAWPEIDGFARRAASPAAADATSRTATYTASKAPEPERTVTLRGQPVSTVQAADVSLRIERNAELVPSRPTAGAFVYRTPWVTAPVPIVPSNTLAAAAQGPSEPTLPRSLAGLFATILGLPAPVAEAGRRRGWRRARPDVGLGRPDENQWAWPVTVTVEYRHIVRRTPQGDEPLYATHPVLLSSAYPFTAADVMPTDPASLVCVLSQSIHDWWSTVVPVAGTLLFEVVVFAGPAASTARGSRAAICHLQQVCLDVPDQPTEAWWEPG